MSINTGDRSQCKYIYDLPSNERRQFCRILDDNDQWEVLGGDKMNFSHLEINEIRREERCGNSPTSKLLSLWGHKNNTILQLYTFLYEMGHYQAMNVLQPFVSKFEISSTDTVSQDSSRPQMKPPYELSKAEGGQFDLNLNDTIVADFISHRERSVMKKTMPQQLHEPEKLNINHPSISISNNNQTITDAKFKILNRPSPEVIDESACNNILQRPIVNLNLNNPETTSQNESISSGVNRVMLDPNHSNRVLNSSISSNSAQSDFGVHNFKYKDLEDSTINWSKEKLLGKGGFGSVYKGLLVNSIVAIKKLNPASTDSMRKNTLDELKYLQKFQHECILQLYGYSHELEHPLCLVYQFMSNGSLECRLGLHHKKSEPVWDQNLEPLNWDKRLQIAKGVAAALYYIHTVIADKPLVHGDVKSANILLDQYLKPKLGDFGLAREAPNRKTTMKVSRVVGTEGYTPDDYRRNKKLTVKVDTYCYGIVLFEICTGRRTYSGFRNEILACNDKSILQDSKGGPDDYNVFSTLLDIGELCVQELSKDRPKMEVVCEKIEKCCEYPMIPALTELLQSNSENRNETSSNTDESNYSTEISSVAPIPVIINANENCFVVTATNKKSMI